MYITQIHINNTFPIITIHNTSTVTNKALSVFFTFINNYAIDYKELAT